MRKLSCGLIKTTAFVKTQMGKMNLKIIQYPSRCEYRHEAVKLENEKGLEKYTIGDCTKLLRHNRVHINKQTNKKLNTEQVDSVGQQTNNRTSIKEMTNAYHRHIENIGHDEIAVAALGIEQRTESGNVQNIFLLRFRIEKKNLNRRALQFLGNMMSCVLFWVFLC